MDRKLFSRANALSPPPLVDITTVMEILQKLDSRLEEINKKFDRQIDEMERAKRSREPLERLQHEMQQSRPTEEAGASGEKTGEREGDAVVNWRNGIFNSPTERVKTPLQMKSSCFRTTWPARLPPLANSLRRAFKQIDVSSFKLLSLY